MKNDSIDFCNICFNDETELKLLQLYAKSFEKVDINIIGKILVFFNDSGDSVISDIKEFFPVQCRDKVDIIYRDEHYSTEQSSWRNQQLYKLLISEFVESPYYVMMDTKNHFLKEISRSDFFVGDSPKLFIGQPGSMINFYFNSLEYFNISSYFDYERNEAGNVPAGNAVMTTTPFVFKTSIVKEMIKNVETLEGKPFDEFFLENEKITEFYLYTSYLMKSGHIVKYVQSPAMFATVFHDPNVSWNSFEHKERDVQNDHIKVFGLHRLSIDRMNNEYKRNLIGLYSRFYSNSIMQLIENEILN